MVERDSSSYPHYTVPAVGVAVVDSVANYPKTHLIMACSRFLQCVEAVIVADGGFIELCYLLPMWSPVQNVKR